VKANATVAASNVHMVSLLIRSSDPLPLYDKRSGAQNLVEKYRYKASGRTLSVLTGEHRASDHPAREALKAANPSCNLVLRHKEGACSGTSGHNGGV